MQGAIPPILQTIPSAFYSFLHLEMSYSLFKSHSEAASSGMPFPTSSSKVSLVFLSYIHNFVYNIFQNLVHYYDCVPMFPANLCFAKGYE